MIVLEVGEVTNRLHQPFINCDIVVNVCRIGVLSSVFVSLNSIFTARVLPLVNNDKSKLLFYNNFNASVLFLPLIFLFEREVSRMISISLRLV